MILLFDIFQVQSVLMSLMTHNWELLFFFLHLLCHGKLVRINHKFVPATYWGVSSEKEKTLLVDKVIKD